MAGNLSAQNLKNDSTNTSIANDTLPDTFQVKGDTLSMPQEKGDIETTIKYSAKDSIKMDVVNKKVYLFGDAKINYGDITLTAALVSIDWANSLMTANAQTDSTGNLIGIPEFKQGGENYEAEEIRYNFKTKKGIISKIVTKQGEGFVTGDKVKRHEDAIYISSAQYTTCNLKHPHFYINARKLKVIPDDKVVSGPFNLVISDVHTPLGFFLGFFPIPKKQKSGLIFPTVGMSAQRGLFLSRGGYYWAVNDYLNFKVMADAYSNGSYNATASSDYNVKYKFSGNLSFTGAKTKNSFSLGETPTKSFNLTWSHRTSVKKNRSFSANVNINSQKYYANNSFNPTAINTNASSSNITYTKGFSGTPFNITVAARQDQNIRGTKIIMNFTLPEVNFSMNRINPFKRKTGSGERWYEKINVAYNLSTKYFTSNLPLNYGFPIYLAPNTQLSKREGTDTLSFNGRGLTDVLKEGQWGAKHSIPISTSMKVMKYFTLTPSFTFNQYFYDRYLDYQTNETPVKVRVVKGLTSTYDYAFSNSITTRIYGTYNLKSKRLMAIRHTAVPNVGYSFHPDFSKPNYNNYENGYTNGSKNTTLLNRFAGAPYGSPGAGRFNGLTFNITNVIEGKVRTKKDTANAVKKINLINNISAGGSYNFLALNQMYLSVIPISATTTLFKVINLTFGTTYDPYLYRKDSISANGTVYQTRLNPKTLTSSERSVYEFKRAQLYSLNISANLNPKALKPKTSTKGPKSELDFINANPNLYLDFNIPWNLNIMFNANYSKTGFAKENTTKSLTLSGDLRITQNWKVAFTTGYDFVQKGVSYTTLTINRDLHCWQASFNVVPFGTRQSYFFTLSAKSSILQDLKLNKRSPAYIGY
jgi:lipopolysaccharide assembly outer membrane protein LptD (OstA)